jgi:hypothetical protein
MKGYRMYEFYPMPTAILVVFILSTLVSGRASNVIGRIWGLLYEIPMFLLALL